MENYYETLHVANFAEIEVVRAAYKAITKLYHPDVNKEVDQCVMVNINLAYEVLGNEKKKKAYDIELRQYLDLISSEYNCDNSSEEGDKQKKVTVENGFASKVVNLASSVASAFMENVYETQKEIENAYYKGSSLSDEQLVKRYMSSVGKTRAGLSRVMLDRGLLYMEDGKIFPSYSLKTIIRKQNHCK